MRILYSHRVQARDGQSVHIEALVAAFRDAGHVVEVVGPGVYDQADFGGESWLVRCVRRLLPAAVAELAEIAYGLVAYLRLAIACRQFKPDLVYERYALYHLAGALLSRTHAVPVFLEVNSPLAQERSAFGTLRLTWLAFALERFTWRSVARVLVVTDVLRGIVAAAGIAQSRIGVTPNGIDLRAYPSPAFATLQSTNVTLGFVGFVRDWHGLDAVLSAMADRGPAGLTLTIVGDGPARGDLQAQARRLGLADRVRFTGVAARHEVPDLIAGFDIALQPRAVGYASPLKIFEYMAAGRAIVAPAQPNIREVLEPDRTAVLFDPDEAGAMWEAITRLAADPALRERLGLAARAEIGRLGYTWADNVCRIEAWLAELEPTAAIKADRLRLGLPIGGAPT